MAPGQRTPGVTHRLCGKMPAPQVGLAPFWAFVLRQFWWKFSYMLLHVAALWDPFTAKVQFVRRDVVRFAGDRGLCCTGSLLAPMALALWSLDWDRRRAHLGDGIGICIRYQRWNVFKKKLTRLLMLNQLCFNWQESPFLRPFFINILCEFMWAFWDFDLEIVGCNGVFLVWEATFFILRHRTSNVHVFVGVWWISGEAERDFWCCGTCDSREKSCLDLKSSTSEDKQR